MITVYGAGNETIPTAMTTLGGANGNGALVTKIASIESDNFYDVKRNGKRLSVVSRFLKLTTVMVQTVDLLHSSSTHLYM